MQQHPRPPGEEGDQHGEPADVEHEPDPGGVSLQLSRLEEEEEPHHHQDDEELEIQRLVDDDVLAEVEAPGARVDELQHAAKAGAKKNRLIRAMRSEASLWFPAPTSTWWNRVAVSPVSPSLCSTRLDQALDL